MNSQRRCMITVLVLGLLFFYGEPVFAEKSSMVENALRLNSLAAWKAFVEQNTPTKLEDTQHSLISFFPERVVVIPKAPNFACKAQQIMIGSAKPAPVIPGQKVLLVTYSFTYGKPLWRVAFGILLGTPARPPDHFDLEIEIQVQALDMGKVDYIWKNKKIPAQTDINVFLTSQCLWMNTCLSGLSFSLVG